jgi:hypothetical protein
LSVPTAAWTIRDVGPYVPSFIIDVSGAGGSDLATIGTAPPTATATSAVQDACGPTVQDLPFSEASYPSSQIGPTSLRVHLVHACANPDAGATCPTVQVLGTVYDLTLKNVLPGASGTAMGELTATMDLREIAPLFTQLGTNPTGDTVCNALASLMPGTSCTACPTDQAAYCLTLSATHISAVLADDLGVTPVVEANIASSCLN